MRGAMRAEKMKGPVDAFAAARKRYAPLVKRVRELATDGVVLLEKEAAGLERSARATAVTGLHRAVRELRRLERELERLEKRVAPSTKRVRRPRALKARATKRARAAA